ncbi:2-aminoethylphosphonate transport system permease PhnU [Anoxybacillus thermarum]|uniref:2-aminoethylphosphonate transport system permease PhnU n=1 Tax=Anoxybacillus thermarum TaxID=404937 RepID=A0A0D0S035_9BACL|nr:ABC transporter permease subunit [Anoxybacillus thermarum]KIQ94286.1 2-aminoethylphosphonate transport system permease PhnU [Anoxybacillus thermarum]
MKWLEKDSFLFLLPAFLLTIVLVGYGVMMAISESLHKNGRLTFQYYIDVFKNNNFIASLSYSLWIALVSTFFSMLIGLLITRWLYYYLKSDFLKIIYWIPMLFPHFVWGYMMVLLFSQSGWFSSLAYRIGIIHHPDEFLVIIKDSHGIGIMITYIWKETPFVILMLLPVYHQLNHQLSSVVKTLGGKDWDVFKTVEWPWIMPVLFETSIIVFAFILSAYEVPYLLGTTYPKMISLLVYEWFFEGDWSNRPKAFAAMLSVTMFIFSIMMAYTSLLIKKRYQMMKGNGK